jgi:ubiquinone/menaquinone biosynthesis C-methylase UbiE
MSSYVCPDCKVELAGLRCPSCKHEFKAKDGYPVLLSNDPKWKASHELVAVYDTIYANHSGVWVDQGRTDEFINYYAGILSRYKADKLLEVGVGEGILMSAVQASNKFGTDLSTQALKKAASRVRAELCIALGETLPFATNTFDVVTSVGVMEHFVDDRISTREILRVVKPGGHYVLLIHVHLTVGETIRQKVREYVWPRPRPFALAKYLLSKVYKRIDQPIQNKYTIAGVKSLLEECGFKVDEVIHKGRNPDVPLIGPHVIIYQCSKPA